MTKIESFLNKFPSNHTKAVYKSFLKKYFELLKIDPEKYISKNRDYKKDIELFLKSLKGRPPLTIRCSISCIKTFLSENDVDFKEKYWKNISKRIQGSRPWTEKQVPTPNQLKRILTHGDARARSFFLTLLSSGMRIGELCQITKNDLHLDEKPPRIRIHGKYTKSGDARNTFITDEARNSLEAWLKIRKNYLKKNAELLNARFDHYKISVDDNRVFPFEPQAGRTMWNRMVKNSELFEIDESTNRLKMNVHSLRTFFRTKLGDVIKTDVIEELMGHEGYLTGSYRDYDLNTLGENYIKGSHKLLIFETIADLSDVHEELKEKDKELKDLKHEMEIMRRQMNQLMTEKLIELDKRKK